MGASHFAAGIVGSGTATVMVLGVVLAGCRPELPDEVERVEVTVRGGEPLHHWIDGGYTRLTPPVHLPSSSDRHDQVEIWAKLAPGSIGVVEGPDGPTLRFGPGTIVDRIELVGSGARRRIVDVRGTSVQDDGRQRFHVLRLGDEELFGYSWPASDETAHRSVTDAMVGELADTEALQRLRGELRQRELDAFRTKNACDGCHQPLQPVAKTAAQRLVRRGTDASGFYVPATVLSDAAVLEGYGRHDLNPGQEHLRIACPDGDAPVLEGARPDVRCASGAVPTATFELAEALRAKDPLARAVCRSRAVLHAAMDDAAREAFASAFARCDIGSTTEAPSNPEDGSGLVL